MTGTTILCKTSEIQVLERMLGWEGLNISLPSDIPETQNDHECADLSNTTLKEQGEDLEVRYLLLTRTNPDCAQMFNQESLTSSQQNLFSVSRPTKVVLHGFR